MSSFITIGNAYSVTTLNGAIILGSAPSLTGSQLGGTIKSTTLVQIPSPI